jgi:Smg protein
MKENVLDVLRYLFEHYMDEDTEVHPDRDSLRDELVEAGFPRSEVSKALVWLEGLAERQPEFPAAATKRHSIRIYVAEELAKLDAECRGFLLYLEQVGVLDPASREWVIERVMALDAEEIDIEELKWVVLMVLFNHPDFEDAYERMEDLVFDGIPGYLH